MSEVEVTAHLDAEIKPEETLVYCATFQLAWNQLCDKVIVQDALCLAGDPPIAQALNQRLIGADDLDEQSYLAMAGFARDGIEERVRSALREKFDHEPMSDIALRDPDEILAYAYLEKALQFATVFPVFEEPLQFSDGGLVESFGIYEPNPAVEQVHVLDYRHRDDFIIRLCGDDEDKIEFGMKAKGFTDDLILAKVPPSSTLQETIDKVLIRATPEGHQIAMRELREAGRNYHYLLNPKLQPGTETLQIPKIKVDVEHSYTELLGGTICNPGWEGYCISKALQAIKFDLNETGARVRSDGALGALGWVIEEPRQFIFDKPFLVFIKEREARYPYLALWVGNSEVLVKGA